MHNKSFTVDNSVTIVGGRNIAAEYFQIDADVEFVDFEVVGLGPVAREVSDTFDQFWNSALSVPIEAYGKTVDAGELPAWRDAIADIDTEGSIYHQALTSPYLVNILEDVVTPLPAVVKVVTDSPKKLKTARGIEEYQELAQVLVEHANNALDELFIITPYFVPRKRGSEFLMSLAENGVRVRVLTNSLASTNHVPVHSGYARHRKRLLEAGVELYELKHGSIDVLDDGTEVEFRATLHTKAIIFDRTTLFIGSLNLDPRSIDINTEMGLFLGSPSIARRFAEAVEEDLPATTYRVALTDGKLRWHFENDGESVVLTKEPQTGIWRRFASGFYRILPIEGQL
jgi:putative cardiolipin synthase